MISSTAHSCNADDVPMNVQDYLAFQSIVFRHAYSDSMSGNDVGIQSLGRRASIVLMFDLHFCHLPHVIHIILQID